ncbi:hypothetical protein [Streptomyces shenzhenensis]|uniref:hypothetical protein n=1 Tax=Streptomyces shenzhenensis TaxID=943815 RepID=UPI0011C3F98D|nr:hypothetical protein [Streptomyces shenzhenensis]
MLPDAQKQERVALDLAEALYGTPHVGERFYGMPFSTALTVVRVAAETGLLNGAPDTTAPEP